MSGTAGLPRTNKLVREELARWIDFATGMRKRRKLKGNTRRHVTRRPKQSAEFRQRGQALVQEPGQVKFAFNAGSKQNKGAVARLMKGLDMNMSEFFSALVERIVRQPGSASLASHSNDPNRGRDARCRAPPAQIPASPILARAPTSGG